MLNKFFNLLQKRNSSDEVFNQYSDKQTITNLKIYFEYLQLNNPGILMIGEAPGYKGCRLTGIPFTSGKIILESKHKIFKEIKNKVNIPHKIVSENTASIVWNFLEQYKKPVPIFWNAFPFHPHIKNNPNSNRKPTKKEIEEGKIYLTLIYKFFNPAKLCSIGKTGEKILKDLFPNKEVIYIRHPSYGGKKEFIEGMKKNFN